VKQETGPERWETSRQECQASVDVLTADSLGFYLVRIVTQQIAGTREGQRGSGATIRLTLPLQKERDE
jgi:two-component sensor histidine kinase